MISNSISYGKQEITEEDIAAVISTLKSDFLTQGPKVQEFEKAFAEYIGSKYAVSVSNGTAALHLSIMGLGLKPNQKVITSPITFAATANAILYNQGQVDFCDIDKETLLLDINLVREKLKRAEKHTYGGIIPVDFAGAPIQMEQFRELADEFDLWLLEDACHAPGGYFRNKEGLQSFCGDGSNADAAIFSFHPVKHITSGEGGMITTNDSKLYERLLRLRSHGITKSSDELNENHGGWYHEMQTLGYNYRLNDIACSLGISQLTRAKKGVQKRKKIAQKYFDALKDIPNINLANGFIEGHAFHLFILQSDRRKELYDFLRKKNIFSQVHYIPVHLHPYYRSLGFKKGDYPIAEEYYTRCISLPIYPSLKEEDLQFVIDSVKEFFSV